jgi:hypothetical protein
MQNRHVGHPRWVSPLDRCVVWFRWRTASEGGPYRRRLSETRRILPDSVEATRVFVDRR